MFALGATTRVYLRSGATDLRLSYDGLYALVVTVLDADPRSGHVFGFCNRARTRAKFLHFDGSGLWVCAKRLERGTFAWPAHGRAQLDAVGLAALLEGFALEARRGWYRRPRSCLGSEHAILRPSIER